MTARAVTTNAIETSSSANPPRASLTEPWVRCTSR